MWPKVWACIHSLVLVSYQSPVEAMLIKYGWLFSWLQTATSASRVTKKSGWTQLGQGKSPWMKWIIAHIIFRTYCIVRKGDDSKICCCINNWGYAGVIQLYKLKHYRLCPGQPSKPIEWPITQYFQKHHAWKVDISLQYHIMPSNGYFISYEMQ